MASPPPARLTARRSAPCAAAIALTMASPSPSPPGARRVPEFGTLKALGWRSSRIVTQVLGESVTIGILGGLAGVGLGFAGQDLATAPESQVRRVRADSFGFIFQTFNLVPTLTAHENVEAALIPLGLHHTQRRERVTAALDSVGLADRAQHLPAELSGGQQQRVAIARVLVKEPRVLLADEPTGNLDEDTRDEIIALLDTLWRERRLTLVLVSHDSSVVRRAQRIGVMSRGRLSIRQDTRA
jgi:putative ABC transport system ATP-binding protein